MPSAVAQGMPSERQVCNNCGHSRAGKYNSQDAMNGWCGGLALPAMIGRSTPVTLRVEPASCSHSLARNEPQAQARNRLPLRAVQQSENATKPI